MNPTQGTLLAESRKVLSSKKPLKTSRRTSQKSARNHAHKTTGTKQKILDAARGLGFQTLRPGQAEAIAGVLSGRDVLAIFPTGAGKSAIYQIAAQLLSGPTLIVSPLLALQKDQLEAIAARGAGEVKALNSTLTENERGGVLASWQNRQIDFLFLAPEQLANEIVFHSLQATPPALIVVDEAHCVVEWGHDFRPDYLRLGAAFEALGSPPILALTATASPPIRSEIIARLKLYEPQVLVRGFDRPNIHLEVRCFDDGEEKRQALIEDVAARIASQSTPGIVYCATRRATEEISDTLRQQNFRERAYHAGLKKSEREQAQNAFMAGDCDCIIATNAFGLGVDKPDVRWILHHDIPDSLDAYYQEIGRAGRDGNAATAVLFYEPSDLNLHRFFTGGGKAKDDEVEQLVEAATKAIAGESITDARELEEKLREQTELSATKVTRAVSAFEVLGIINDENLDSEIGQRIEDAMHELASQEAQRKEFERSRLEMMRVYTELVACRRSFILNYFGDEYSGETCNNCDNCAGSDYGETVIKVEATRDENLTVRPFAIHARVRHDEWGEGEVIRYESDKVVVLFDAVGYKTLALAVVVENNLLTALP